MLPFLAGFLLTYVLPIAYAFSQSLHEKKSTGLGFGPTRVVYTGFANFASVLADEAFWAEHAAHPALRRRRRSR